MATDLRSKTIRLTIGGVDWSDYCTEAILQWEELDLKSGLVKGSGRFTLDVSEIDPLPSYRKDPDQWAKGTLVLFETVNSAGAWVTPPMGRLRIRVPPKTPSVGNPIIDLECVCVLDLFDFTQPSGDASGVTVGTPRDRDLIIADVLAQNSLSSSLSSIPHPLDYPVPKKNGSWVQQAGEIAGAAGHFLYQNNAGAIVNKGVDLDPTAIATITIGANEAEWEPSEGTETPVEKLIVGGATYAVNSLFGNITVAEKSGTKGNVLPQFSTLTWASDNVGVYERVTIQEGAYDPVTKSQSTVTTKEKARIATPAGLSAYNVLESTGFQMIAWEQTTDTNYYGDSGELRKQLCITNQIKTEIIGQAWRNESFDLTLLEKIETDIFYDSALQVTSLRVQRWIPKYKDTGTLVNPFAVIKESDLISTWTDLGAGKWLFKKEGQELLKIPASRFVHVVNGVQVFDVTLIGQSIFGNAPTETYIANDGSADPPQTQYLKLNELIEQPLTSCVTFSGAESILYGDRTRSITVDYGASKEQLYQFGEKYNALIWGRRFGWRVGTAITDAILSASPLDAVTVIDGSDTYKLLIDGLTLVFDGQESYAAFNGIEVAYNGSPAFTAILSGSGAMTASVTMTGAGATSGNVFPGSTSITMTGEIVIGLTSASGSMSAPVKMTGMNADAAIFMTGLNGAAEVIQGGIQATPTITMVGSGT